MSNYNITTDFGGKDSLASGNAQKVVKGSEFTTEFTNIKTAVNSKADKAGDTFTGNVNINADLTVDTNVFVVNTTTNKVGVNNATPSDTLDVTGSLGVSGNGTVGGTLGVTGDTTLSAALGVTGATTLSDTLAVTNATTVGGTLGVTGATTLSDTLAVTSNSTVGGTLGVTGDTTLSNATLSGTLDVTGVSTLSDDLILDTDAVSLTNTDNQGGKGRIGVGTATPVFHVEVAQTTDGYIGFKTPSTKSNYIYFHASDVNTTKGIIEYNHPSDALYFKVNGSSTNALTLASDNTLYTPNRISVNESNPANIEGRVHVGSTNTTPAFSVNNTSTTGVGNPCTVLDYQRDGATTSQLIMNDIGSLSFIQGTTQGDGGFGFITDALQPMTIGAVSAFGVNNGGCHLGTSTNRWGTVYLTASPNVSSDQRLKENIADADDAGNTIDNIQIRKFDWIESGEHQSYGVVAQELAEVFPEAVNVAENEEDIMGVSYEKLIPMLVKEVQSLRSRVAELEDK